MSISVAILTTDRREPEKDYSNPRPSFGTAPEALLEGLSALPGNPSPHRLLLATATRAVAGKIGRQYLVSWPARPETRLDADALPRLHPSDGEKVARNQTRHRSRPGHGARLRRERHLLRFPQRADDSWEHAVGGETLRRAAVQFSLAGGTAGNAGAQADRRRVLQFGLHGRFGRACRQKNLARAERRAPSVPRPTARGPAARRTRDRFY